MSRLGALVLSVAAVGCGSSEVSGPPSEFANSSSPTSIAITGRLIHEDGTGFGQHACTLSLETAWLEGGWGHRCDEDDTSVVCNPSRSVVTSTDGTFVVNMTSDDVQYNGRARRITFTADGAEQSTTTSEFYIQKSSVALGRIVLWDGDVTINDDNKHVKLDFARPVSLASDGKVHLVFKDAAQNSAWAQDISPDEQMDSRLFEDISGTFLLEATGKDEGHDGVQLTMKKRPSPFTGSAGAPPSRGKSCWSESASFIAPTVTTSCRLTDGSFGAAITPVATSSSSSSSSGGKWIAVDLGTPQMVTMAVVRALAPSAVVEVSLDATIWLPITKENSVSDTAHLTTTGMLARFVRVRDSNGNAITAMTELSVW